MGVSHRYLCARLCADAIDKKIPAVHEATLFHTTCVWDNFSPPPTWCTRKWVHHDARDTIARDSLCANGTGETTTPPPRRHDDITLQRGSLSHTCFSIYEPLFCTFKRLTTNHRTLTTNHLGMLLGYRAGRPERQPPQKNQGKGLRSLRSVVWMLRVLGL